MAARFQRLETSEDIAGSPEINYTSNYYDEPQNIYSADDRRRMSHTTRKPVPNNSDSPFQSQSPPPPEQPLMNPAMHNAYQPYGSPQYTSGSFSNDSYRMHPERTTTETSFTDDPKRKARSSVLALTKTASSLWNMARGGRVSHVATPLFAAPWRHEPCTDLGSVRASTVRSFDRKKQRRRIFFHFFLQWLVPLAFVLAIFGTLYYYSTPHKIQISHQEKYVFNALMLGFALCLGFAVVSGMQEYANIMRWRLLASGYYPLQQFEMLLGLSSQKKALRLLWVARTPGKFLPNSIQVLCLGYLFIMFGLQLAIALLGLCFSVDTADSQFRLFRGNVSIADMSFIQQSDYVANNIDDMYQLQSGSVNNYGISGQRYGVVYTELNDSSIPSAWYSLPLFTDNSTMWWYYFSDRCTQANCSISYWTNRWASANATCKELKVTAGGWVDNDTVTYLDDSGRKRYWDYLGGETSATTTWYSETTNTCGDRCTAIHVLNVGYEGLTAEDTWQPQFFECNNTVPQIGNITHLTTSQAYELPDQQARLIAGSIGYNGVTYLERNITYQYHTYDIGSLFSWTRLNGARMSATDIANLIMRFSMGAVAAMDIGGQRKIVLGDSPTTALDVSVKWPATIAILVGVPAVQFLVLLIVTVWGNKAVIKDGSYLSTAVLLRPITDQMERTGCALTGDEVCEALGNPQVAYGVRMPEGGSMYGGMNKGNDEVMHLDVIPEHEGSKVSDVGWRTGLVMPQGRYDGLKRQNESIAISTARNTGTLRERKRRMSL